MQVFVYPDKVYFSCQVKDLCKLISMYADEYKTVQDLLKALALH